MRGVFLYKINVGVIYRLITKSVANIRDPRGESYKCKLTPLYIQGVIGGPLVSNLLWKPTSQLTPHLFALQKTFSLNFSVTIMVFF